MLDLLQKELRLALHPAAVMFVALAAMLLIPGYPYYVVCFYGCLGLLFVCQFGRENKDIEFTLLLPVRKRDAVKARFMLAALLQLVQLLLGVPFAFLRALLPVGPNPVGMDANTAFFGIALALYGIFNFVFFSLYYRDPAKVGASFLWGSAAFAAAMVLAEAPTYFVPFFRDRLDTPDPLFLPEKLIVLAAGAGVWALLTYAAYRRSVSRFESLDL